MVCFHVHHPVDELTHLVIADRLAELGEQDLRRGVISHLQIDVCEDRCRPAESTGGREGRLQTRFTTSDWVALGTKPTPNCDTTSDEIDVQERMIVEDRPAKSATSVASAAWSAKSACAISPSLIAARIASGLADDDRVVVLARELGGRCGDREAQATSDASIEGILDRIDDYGLGRCARRRGERDEQRHATSEMRS